MVKIREIDWILYRTDFILMIWKHGLLVFIYVVLLCFLSLIMILGWLCLLLMLIEGAQVSETNNSHLLISSSLNLFLNILPVFTMLNQTFCNIHHLLNFAKSEFYLPLINLSISSGFHSANDLRLIFLGLSFLTFLIGFRIGGEFPLSDV